MHMCCYKVLLTFQFVHQYLLSIPPPEIPSDFASVETCLPFHSNPDDTEGTQSVHWLASLSSIINL